MRLILYIALLAVVPSLEGLEDTEERLIGWQGEQYSPFNRHEETTDNIGEGPLYSSNQTIRPGWVQVISWKPRAFVYHNFLSDQEVRHIIDLAHAQMKRSQVVGGKDEGVVDDIRTSYGTFLRRNQDPVIASIEHRLSLWSHLPVSHQEDMQVLRYGPTNKYGPHIDGLGRVATVLMYLVAPTLGGETAFIDSRWAHPELEAQAKTMNFSACAKGHVAFVPKRGDALLFYDTLPDYQQTDGASMHTGCPVVEGVKWNAVKWLHGIPFRPEEYDKAMKEPFEPLPDPGVCANLHDMCQEWATQGECKNNAGYMTGTGGDGIGSCRLACKDCEPCAEGDEDCYRRNRASGGFLVSDEAELSGF